jgi:hypothetical protein
VGVGGLVELRLGLELLLLSLADDFPSLVLDSSGTPYLAYVDVDDSKASVMRFR